MGEIENQGGIRNPKNDSVSVRMLGQISSVSSSSIRGVDEKVYISWSDINYQTLIKDNTSTFLKPVYKLKKMLVNMNGHAESGELLAILGPTGCGKTSLLNVLAARVQTGGESFCKLSGTIYVNGKLRNEDNFRKISAYVLQDDNMYPHLTVFETLLLAANFYLPESFSTSQKESIANSTIAELGLVKAKNTVIGDDNIRGVSGGERKRTSIAVQLLTDPAVLFLDEPTSGLDAFQSLAVMEAMKNLALTGRLVISVIHQPRSSIYEMFDKLLVLSEGKIMYYGDANKAIGYFGNLGHHCPDAFNPSDYFLDLLSPDNRSLESTTSTQNRIQYIGNAWIQFQLKMNEDSNNNNDNNKYKPIQVIGNDSFSIHRTYHNFVLLCWRAWIEQIRATGTIIAKFVFNIFFASIIGGIYSNIGYDQESIQNRIGVLYFLLINQSFGSITSVLNTFPREKNIVARELSQNAYSTLSYFAAKIIIELPLLLLPLICYNVIVYQLIGLQKGIQFLYFILISLLVNLVATSLGFTVSSLAPNAEAATALGVPLLIVFILFGGFYISVNSLPVVANLIPYISLFRWGFEALCINEFQGLTFTCDTKGRCLKTGEDVLQTLDFNGVKLGLPVFALGMLGIGIYALAYFFLLSNKIKFTPLGYCGNKFNKYISNAIEITSTAPVENTDNGKVEANQVVKSYEPVPSNEQEIIM